MKRKTKRSEVALVSGASRGIGLAIARRFCERGISVALVARNSRRLNRVFQDLTRAGFDAFPIKCDVSSESSVKDCLIEVKRKFGRVDILVNNAGFGGPFHLADEVSSNEWKKLFMTNIDSLHFFCRNLLPEMKKYKYGRILNISSVFGEFGNPHSSTYAATKHAVIGYTRSIAAEWGAFGITCNAISPGFIETDMTNKSGKSNQLLLRRIPTHRMGTPEEIAACAEFLCSKEAAYINGTNLVVDGGLSCHLSGELGSIFNKK